MPDIFLSHASEDKPRIRALADALRREGLDVWLDENVSIGDAWAPEIVRKLEESRCIVVCWSESAIQKASSKDKLWIRSEADAAIERGAIVAVLLDEVHPPRPYDQVQTLRLVGWNGDPSHPAYRAFLAELRKKLDATPLTTGDGPAQRGSRRALLIGVSGGGATKLPGLPAVNGNLKGLEAALRQPSCAFEVEKLFNPTHNTLQRTLQQFFRDCPPDSLVLLYYCGHLVFDEARSPYLTAEDTELDLLDSTAVSLEWLRTKVLDKAPEGPRLILVDGCYREADPMEVKDTLQYGFGQGKVVIASSAGPGSGPEGWREQQSPLTGYVIRALSSADADSDKNRSVTAQEMFDYAKKQIDKTRRYPSPLLLSTGCDPSQVVLTSTSASSTDPSPPSPEQMQLVRLLAPEMEAGAVVVFVGDGIFGTGPLSGMRLTDALADKAGMTSTAPRDESIIATPAEWLEQRHRSRSLFLSMFRKILEEQSSRSLPNAAHDLIVEAKRPWLTISATYDRLLEDRLDDAGIPYVTLAHILDSKRGEDNNKILVVRNRHHPAVKGDPQMEAEICMPDEVFVEDEVCILYKLLGSPFLHDLRLAKEREIDTLVVTESNYMTLLMALQQGKTVPTVLSTRLEQKRLLFLGFKLQLWHYRLIGHLFGVPRGDRSVRSGVLQLSVDPIAIPPPTTVLEEMFWQRLKPERVIDISLPTLVQALRAERSAS